MRILLVVAALAVTVPAAAESQSFGGSQFSAGTRAHDGRDRRRDAPDFERNRDGDDRRDGRRRGYPSVYRDYYDANGRVSDRAWQPDSFNDWWHERPSRAYPAWMARNGKCERMWWSGGAWRC